MTNRRSRKSADPSKASDAPESGDARADDPSVDGDRRPTEPTIEPLAYTILEFCRRHRICRTHYYELRADDKGPDEMLLGRRRKAISVEAAARWRRAREEDAKRRDHDTEPEAPDEDEEL